MKRFGILLSVIVFLFASGLTHAQSGKPKMQIDQEVFEAGEVYRPGPNIEHAFVIRNTGTAELNILSATPG